jgi:ATP-dependent helicase/nuclease subunit B
LEVTLPKTEEMDTEEKMRAFAREEGERILQKPVYSTQKDTESGKFFTEKLLGEGVEVAVAAYRQLRNSDFHIENLEGRVDGEFFHGKVDRVDGSTCSEQDKANGKKEYVRVVDYKTGHIDDSAAAYYTGRKIQMQLYMTEVKGERVPAGVFYFPAALDYASVEDGRFRMRGFLNGSEDALRCGDNHIQEKVKSEYFPAALKNTGQVKRVMDEDMFKDFIDYSTLVARQGYNELKDGYMEATPYQKACDYCKFGGMCGFCKDVSEWRKEDTIDPKDIANIVKNAKGGN